MISLFASTPAAAARRAAIVLLTLSIIPIVIIHILPIQLVLAMRAGPNVRTVLTMMPISGYLVDWVTRAYAALPSIVHVIIGILIGSTLCMLRATLFPGAVMTWASLAAWVVVVSGGYYWMMSLKKDKTDTSSNENMLLHSLVILGVTMLSFVMASRTLGVYMALLMPRLGLDECAACILLASLVTIAYINMSSPDSRPKTKNSEKMQHVQLLSASTVMVTMAMMLVKELHVLV